MASFIRQLELLVKQASHLKLPDEGEIDAAARVLGSSPVEAYAAFRYEEVKLLAAYRIYARTPGGYDAIWPSIVNGEPMAWVYAIHEAEELAAFADFGINPFDRIQFNRYLQEAHSKATVAELQFLTVWAEQKAFQTSMLALELQNPDRRQYAGHRSFVIALQTREHWQQPSETEIQAAEQFWQWLLGE